MTQRFTGRHMAGILIAFFAIVIAVNVTMARLAGSTFGGVIVDNSYVASQRFNGWLDEAAKEQALGWQADVHRTARDRVGITLTAENRTIVRIVATARHPLGRLADRDLTFTSFGNGRFISRQTLSAGRWRLRLAVDAGGQTWRTEKDLF